MAILPLSLSLHPPPNLTQNPKPTSSSTLIPTTSTTVFTSPRTPNKTTCKRDFILKTTSFCITLSLALQNPLGVSLAEPSSPSKLGLSGIANTKSWFQFYGDGFAIRVPPQFEDIMEPEVYFLHRIVHVFGCS